MSTNDPFTEAARAEAVRWWQIPASSPGNVIEQLGQHMAKWARTHLAEQEPTEDDAYAAYVEWNLHVAYGERGAIRCHCGAPGVWGTTAAHEQHSLWHALSAARNARRDEETR